MFIRLFVLFLCCALSAGAFGQSLTDDFSDGDLLNPQWTGDTEDFVVTDGRLRLMADGAGESTLQVALLEPGLPVETPPDSFSVSLLVDMDFAPSASNLARINLVNQSSQNSVGAYFLNTQIGGYSGTVDFWSGEAVVDGDLVVGTFAGTEGALAGPPAVARVRIEYVRGRGYRFFADYAGGFDYVLEAEIVENEAGTAWVRIDALEIRCEYTATRADKFSFDDLNAFYAYPTDETPPGIGSASVQDARTIRLSYTEAVTDQALLSASYTLTLPDVTVTEVNLASGVYVLTLGQDLPVQTPFTLRVANATDLAGNASGPLTTTLVYDPVVPPTVENLRINELMVDPNPTVGLPNAEYVELRNVGTATVDLTGLQLVSGSSVGTIAGGRLAAGGYVVVVDEDDLPLFSGLPEGSVVAAEGLPTLTNSADDIALRFGGAGNTWGTLEYTDAWYNDATRDDGGYSLEFTGGADAGCSGNWRASLDASGGTPGRANSVDGLPADATPPLVTETDVTLAGFTLIFDEPLAAGQLTADLFSVTPALALAEPRALADNGVFLAADVAPGVVYTLTVLPDFSDCAGNFATEPLVLTLAIPADPAPGDVVINEILFNPRTGGSDYVELYNCSDKVLQVAGWTLRNDQSSSSSASRTVTGRRLFLPGEHLTFTPDRDDVLDAFRDVDPALLVEQTLPTLPDDAGNLTVLAGGVVLDAFDYSEELHNPLLSPNDGVSLERIRYKAVTQQGSNWYSAASDVGFGTPTRPNSQLNNDTSPPAGDDVFSLTRETFSPDGDGFEDFLELRYDTPTTGYLARVRIFDAQGRTVRTLRRTELLGTTGRIVWAGETDELRRARAGIYVLLVELFNPNGDTTEEKLVAVLAGNR